MGIREKRMETTIVYWGYIGIMDKRMETTMHATLPDSLENAWQVHRLIEVLQDLDQQQSPQ